MFNFVLSIIPAIGLAPIYGRAAAGTVMAKFEFNVSMELVLRELILINYIIHDIL